MVLRNLNSISQLAWKITHLLWIPMVLIGGTLIGRGLYSLLTML